MSWNYISQHFTKSRKDNNSRVTRYKTSLADDSSFTCFRHESSLSNYILIIVMIAEDIFLVFTLRHSVSFRIKSQERTKKILIPFCHVVLYIIYDWERLCICKMDGFSWVDMSLVLWGPVVCYHRDCIIYLIHQLQTNKMTKTKTTKKSENSQRQKSNLSFRKILLTSLNGSQHFYMLGFCQGSRKNNIFLYFWNWKLSILRKLQLVEKELYMYGEHN